MADEPVPITPTRCPVKSTPSCGQRPVWYVAPSNVSRPGKSGMFADDRQPVAMIRKRAVHSSPGSVRTVHRPVASSQRGRLDAGVELDVATQVEAVGDVVGVLQDLGLGRVALGPVPLLLELVGELVRVLHALDVAARAGVAVPVPGAADAAARLEHPRRHAEPAHTVEHVHARRSPRPRSRRRTRPSPHRTIPVQGNVARRTSNAAEPELRPGPGRFAEQ